MEVDELKEAEEKARSTGGRAVGLTMAIVAVLLALTTMLGNNMDTDQIIQQTQATDQWAYYQAKNIRSHNYNAQAKIAALLPNGAATSAEFLKMAESQKADAEDIKKEAKKLEVQAQLTGRKGDIYDYGEVMLEMTIVLCSLTLLTDSKLYWKVSFLTTAAGIVLGVVATFLH